MADTAGIDVTLEQRAHTATVPVGTASAAWSPPKPGDFKLPVECLQTAISPVKPLEIDTTIVVAGKKYDGKKFSDFVMLSNIGNGAHGMVQKYRHKPSNTLMAIKRVYCSSKEEEKTYAIRELEISRKLVGCEYTVNFYGAFFRESDGIMTAVWLCMEIMDTSLYHFYKVLHKHHISIPEDILGKMAFAIISGLKYLHDALDVIHRDVKPSNILLDRAGNVKLCDYSIAGYLVKSLASTMNTGYVPYLAPERICPLQALDPKNPTYDIRADVWSFGITMVEVATAKHPFAKEGETQTMFDQMMEVVRDSSHIGLPPGQFSDDFTKFIDFCLKRNVAERPKYDAVLQHKFMAFHSAAAADSCDVMATFVKNHLVQFASEFSFHQDSKNN